MDAAARQTRQNTDQERQEAYNQWRAEQLSDPRFAGVRMLSDDLREHGQIMSETWERFDIEERTWAAEVLNAPHSHIDRFRFDGQDVIVKETDGINPRLTLRDVYQNGLNKTRADVEAEPGLAYQLRRDELFMQFYEEIERMMRGQTEHDTIHMISTCPLPSELSDDPQEAARLMGLRWYDNDRRKSFDYTARRLPNGELELSATTLDSSNLDAHARVLQEFGYENVNFSMINSHEFGNFLSFDSTAQTPIEVVIASRVGAYDDELQRQTGKKHRYGRQDDTIDAHEFFAEYCDDYWAGYKACHELLAQHIEGQSLDERLQSYLLDCLNAQEQVGKSVLKQDKLHRLRLQLQGGHVTSDMVMSCRELLVYNHHATLAKLLQEFKDTGKVTQLNFAGGADFLDAYTDDAGANGTEAAARGDVFAGCETATSVNSLTQAAQEATSNGRSLEQQLRMEQEEAEHCLRIKLYGYTIRRNVHCPFCSKKVDAKDTTATIECLDKECRKVLDKATGRISVRLDVSHAADVEPNEAAAPVKLRDNELYSIGSQTYQRQVLTVVGGAQVTYIDPAGARIEGVAAQTMDAIISQQLAAAPRAA